MVRKNPLQTKAMDLIDWTRSALELPTDSDRSNKKFKLFHDGTDDEPQ